MTSAALGAMDRAGLGGAVSSAAEKTRTMLGPAGARLPGLLEAMGVKLPGFPKAEPQLSTPRRESEDRDLPGSATNPQRPGPGSDSSSTQPKGIVPPSEFSDADLKWIDKGETLLRNAGIDPAEVYGHLPENSYGRLRAAGVVAKTALSGAAVKAGVDVRAFEFALNHGGKGNPTRFANAYEYYFDSYRTAYRNVDTSKPFPPGKNKYGIAADNLDDRAVSAALQRDVAEVESIGKSAIAVPSGGDPKNVAARLQRASDLGFADPVSAAYHAPKHLGELPPSDLNGKSPIRAYLDSAETTIRDGRLVDVQPVSGGRMFYFHRDVDMDGKSVSTEAIVFVGDDGVASIASYGKPKAVQAGTPEYQFPDDDVDVDLTHGAAPTAVQQPQLPPARSPTEGLVQSLQSELDMLSRIAGPVLGMLINPSLIQPSVQQPPKIPVRRALSLNINVPSKIGYRGQRRSESLRMLGYGAGLLR